MHGKRNHANRPNDGAHATLLSRIGQIERARALLIEARESPFSSAELDAAIDAELAKVG